MHRTSRHLPIVFLILCSLAASGPLIAQTEPAVPEPEHPEARELLDFVNRAATVVAEKGAASCADFKRDAWRLGDAYVFVIDLEGNAVCHPARPDLEGTSVRELRDPDGKPIIQLFLRQVEDDSTDGWVHYLWPRPDRNVLHWKTSYVRRVAHEGEDLVVGAGVYELPMEAFFVVDRVNEAVELLRRHGVDAFDVLRDPSGGFMYHDAYVFVMGADGVMHVNPEFPDMEGEHVLDVQDAAGHYPGREILAAVEDQDAAWVGYRWPRPHDTRAAFKETYVRTVKVGGEKLMVASGLYAD